MRYEIKVPSTADGALAVTITAWLKNVGDNVSRSADLVEMTTEKITLYATSPADGKLVEILLEKGSNASVGDVIGVVEGD
jgi:pyruvate/2-oxoglutarate dehydrogenase complex dihydrolipoamide acyltransferase (E2) component